jgi:putative nucleotidyltransferase with HDIG domain
MRAQYRPVISDYSFRDGPEQRKNAALGRLALLPTFSSASSELLTISSDSEQSVDKLINIVKSDPTVAADLLRVANSAEFCMQSRIADVQHAFALIGFERTRSLALSIAMRQYTNRALRRVDVYRYWAHSIATAVIEEALAAAEGYSIHLAYTGGLLHDIGRLGLLLTSRERYLEIQRINFERISAVNELEQALFGLSHCEAGAFLAVSWQFPEALRDCVRQHHDDRTPGDSDLLRLTKIACRVADAVGFSESGTNWREDPAQLLASQCEPRSDVSVGRLQNLVTKRLVSLSF